MNETQTQPSMACDIRFETGAAPQVTHTCCRLRGHADLCPLCTSTWDRPGGTVTPNGGQR